MEAKSTTALFEVERIEAIKHTCIRVTTQVERDKRLVGVDGYVSNSRKLLQTSLRFHWSGTSFQLTFVVCSAFVQILQEAQSADATLRDDAERKLRHLQTTDAAGFLRSLSRELASAEKPVDTRRLAGLILKNALDAKDEKRKVSEMYRSRMQDGE